MKSVRTLLHSIIDYAGLFPPAGLAMFPAVRNYAAYLAGNAFWMLGRFILPVARLEEFETAASDLLPRNPDATPWRLSVLAGTDLDAEIMQILAFNTRHASGSKQGMAIIDTIEIKTADVAAIHTAVERIPGTLTAYVEIPLNAEIESLIAALDEAGTRAKVRTGGLSSEMFPATDDLLHFMHACVRAEVPFKATAGLHHPLRSVHRLTYEPHSESAMMHGFLNVFLAAAFLSEGMDRNLAGELIEETSLEAFHFSNDGIAWREHWLDNEALARARQLAISFGSCSFQEPIDDLEALGLL
ncbi:MAG: hypothetical protein KatS3mg057_2238 [Herpetosiphonaceae bacterium]|nr:MAG: hypothetical protein KatS3mg057_2238 [Herpetosiphonaceae bacterium]